MSCCPRDVTRRPSPHVGSVQAPAGWEAACTLDSRTGEGGAVDFEPVSWPSSSIRRFSSAPFCVMSICRARHHTCIHHAISIAGDTAEATVVPADFAAGYGTLVAEAGALFASRHYRHYLWLLSLSDHIAHFGEEHHESSDDRLPRPC